MKLLSPKLDIVFKRLFTSADSSDILTDFLASILDMEPEEISSIRVLNSDVVPEYEDQKYSRLDIVMEANDKLVNIEMQMRKLVDFRKRVLFYWSKLYTRDLKKGDSYKNLKPTISINILDYNMFDCEECHSIFRLREDNRNELLTDYCRFDFLELPKAGTDSRQIRQLRRWLNFLNIKNEEEADMIAQTNDRIMRKAVFILKEMSADEKMQEEVRIRERALHDEASYLEDARAEGIVIGEKRGIKKGIDIGEKRGMEKGIGIGREEGINVVLEAMRAAGMDTSLIDLSKI